MKDYRHLATPRGLKDRSLVWALLGSSLIAITLVISIAVSQQNKKKHAPLLPTPTTTGKTSSKQSAHYNFYSLLTDSSNNTE